MAKKDKSKAKKNNLYLWKSGASMALTGFGITSKESVDERYSYESNDPPEMRKEEFLFLNVGEEDAKAIEKDLKRFSHDGKKEWFRFPPEQAVMILLGIIESQFPHHRAKFDEAVSKIDLPATEHRRHTAKVKQVAVSRVAALGKERYADRKAKGLCHKCGEPAITKKNGEKSVWCEKCYAPVKKANAERRSK